MALTLLSPLNNVFRRDVAVHSGLSVDPSAATSIVSGEWININSDGQAAAPAGTSADTLLFQVFTEKGDYSS
jgi:hypothetical protein